MFMRLYRGRRVPDLAPMNLPVRLTAAAGFFSISVLIACSSDDTSSTGSGSSALSCPQQGSTCSAAENDTYSSCIQNACDAQYKECLGPSYRSGSFSGVCADYLNCTSKCNCDAACRQKCTISAECTSCFLKTQTCSGTCKAPACASGGGGTGTGDGGGGGGGGADCAGLEACCNTMSGAEKDQCTSMYNAVKSSAAACDAAVKSYQNSGKCK